MAKSTVDMIKEFGQQVGAFAGLAVQDQVMAGAEGITQKTGAEQISVWVKGAIDHLDELVDERTRVRIMETCGTNCARVNQVIIERARARHSKYGSEEAFLAAEQRKPQAGTRLQREGDILYQTYTPQVFSRPMRCYCGLMRGLPEGTQASPTYCHCSRAFVKAFWEGTLGRPVTVEILESAITGAAECRFKITTLS